MASSHVYETVKSVFIFAQYFIESCANIDRDVIIGRRTLVVEKMRRPSVSHRLRVEPVNICREITAFTLRLHAFQTAFTHFTIECLLGFSKFLSVLCTCVRSIVRRCMNLLMLLGQYLRIFASLWLS